MKKTICIFILLSVMFVLISGCDKQDDKNAQEITPALPAPESNVISNQELDSKEEVIVIGDEEIPVYIVEKPEQRAAVRDGVLQFTLDNGESWEDIPLSTDLLYSRGDQSDGVMSNVQEGSCYISESYMIVTYGGSEQVPLTANVSRDGGNTWTKTEVDNTFGSVRAIYVSCPENSDYVYIVTGMGRAMGAEGNQLYRCRKDSDSWENIEMSMPSDGIHLLTIDFSFLDENTGFICTKGGGQPYMLITHDGGETWKLAEFEEPEWGYFKAYAPEKTEDGLRLYLGDENYPKHSGYAYEMFSHDNGDTWTTGELYYLK